MTTFNQWCLYSIQQMRIDIGPGVSGWDVTREGEVLRSLLTNAQNSIGTPEAEQLDVRNRVVQQVTDDLPGAGTPTDRENAATRGEFGAALVQAQAHFQALVDEDEDEAL